MAAGQMHSDQVIIEASQAADLIYDQFPQFRGKPVVAMDTAGTVNAIFRVGPGHAARFPLRMVEAVAAKKILDAEVRASAEFNGSCPFPSPRPIGIGSPTLTYPMPWLIQTWIDGYTARPDGTSSSSAFAHDLVRLISTLRAVAVSERKFDGQGRGGNLRDHDHWMAVCFEKSEQLVDVSRLRRVWTGLRDLPSPQHDVMSHKDLIPGNLLVRGERLVGVLDTGGFGPADPSLDLVAGWHLLDRDRRADFHAALHVDEIAWRRGAAWALQQAMGLVWYYKETNPTMSELGRSTLARILEQYDDLLQ